ncbi:hypothetical protein ACCO45_001404 [Purpureocillium lilacinum]|uniref:Uncharacterized protein n=1 Tax=Purpureocillium lilacinum TaxID=33203 RepID=A0ACC4E9R4_PURLI
MTTLRTKVRVLCAVDECNGKLGGKVDRAQGFVGDLVARHHWSSATTRKSTSCLKGATGGKKGLANRPLIRELLRLCVGSLSSPDRPLQVPPILLPACQPSQLAPTHLGWARGLHWSPGGPPPPPGAPGLHQRGAPGSFGPIHPSSRPRFGGSPLLQIPIPLPPRLSVWRIPDAWPGPPPSVSVSHRRQSAPSPLSAGPPGRRRGQTDTSTRTVQSVLVFVGAALCTFLSTARCHVPGSSTERQFLPGERFSALRTGPA